MAAPRAGALRDVLRGRHGARVAAEPLGARGNRPAGGDPAVPPFDLTCSAGVRRITGSPPLSANRDPRRFACAVGCVWLLATGALFTASATFAGYVLGGAFVATAGLVATVHFCIPSHIYGAACSRLTARAA